MPPAGNREWPRVSVVILNWNNYPDTRDCLYSLQAAGYRNHEVIVVDNGSTDDSPRRLREEFPSCLHIRNPENLGFAAGCNRGIERALERGAAYICLLNNDTVVEPGFLEPAVQAAEADPGIGIVGGKTLWHGTPGLIDSTGATRVFLLLGAARGRGSGERDRGQYGRPCDLQATGGGLMLVRRQVVEDLGFFSEDFFFSHEDVDFCLRARKKGYRIRYVPGFRAWHKVGASHDRLEPRWVYNFLLSRLLLVRKHLPRWQWPLARFLLSEWARYWWLRKLQKAGPGSLSPRVRGAVEMALARASRVDRVTWRDLEEIDRLLAGGEGGRP